MTLTASSTLPEVALAVGANLRRHGIRAVLTGGACVAVYTDGRYISRDADFVIENAVTQQAVDGAMAELGFRRKGRQYVHDAVPFSVEFPPAPLSIGSDYAVQPVEIDAPDGPVLALSPTDSCRDRLAAYFFWKDRQSLQLAIEITRFNEVDFAAIRRWSKQEGHDEDFEDFRREAEAARVRPKGLP